MPYFLSPIGNDQQCSASGAPLSGGKIYTYLAGTSTPSPTYTDSTSGTTQANPIILNSLGLPASAIWMNGGISLKFVIRDAADVLIRTIDNVSGINDSAINASEWTDYTAVPTYISATSFSVPGDQTLTFQVNRRVRTSNTGGLVYGRITASVYASTITTVTVLNDSGALDAGLSVVSYGFLSFSPTSLPYAIYAGAGANADITSMTALTSIPDGSVSNIPTVNSSFKKLAASATGSSANVSVTADEVVLSNSGNQYVTLRAVSLTIAGTSVGANALDAGTIAASTWYSVWVIWNGTTTAGLLSLSATAPTLPSGYTHKARIGWIRTDGTGNKYPLSFQQYGRRVQYKVAGNVANIPIMASGVNGSVSIPTWVAVAWANYAPSTAAKLQMALKINNANAMVAPSNSYGSKDSFTNPPSLELGNTAVLTGSIELIPESSSVYWAADAANCLLAIQGWEDNI